ncbi:hypothetical protein QJS10_CPA02g01112 [Acorus calamus]|uniref:Uncharacterized protein n=1 Tax=Acorus calamus TaxID=4465 RepID=A0AAV9FCL5_ACOCL|nr:hypothetical protein QJS10_CPA02g01112 [Acorus calamus]
MKMELVDRQTIAEIGEGVLDEWEYKGARGAAGGILICWNSTRWRAVEKLEGSGHYTCKTGVPTRCDGDPMQQGHSQSRMPMHGGDRVNTEARSHTGFQTAFTSLDELWAAQAGMGNSTNSLLDTTIARIIIPAETWTIWRTRNEAIFREMRVYKENMWNMFRACIQDWGLFIAKVEEVSFKSGRMCVAR